MFGTVLNRFIVQAVAGHPLTVYGKGNQTRGMLNIKDTLACVELAVLHPAKVGEYRVFNQFTESFSINAMADRVVAALGGDHEIQRLSDPRVEMEDHYYNAAHTKLVDLGLHPHLLDDETIRNLAGIVEKHRDRIDLSVMVPTIDWRATASSLQDRAAAPFGRGRDRRRLLAAISMAAALVTGASGFIGSALVAALRAEGADVFVVDLRPFPDPTVPGVVGDLCDPAVLDAALASRPETIFHLAARTSVLQSMKDPQGVYDVNVAVTQRLLEGARRGRHAVVRLRVDERRGGRDGRRAHRRGDTDAPADAVRRDQGRRRDAVLGVRVLLRPRRLLRSVSPTSTAAAWAARTRSSCA